MGLVLFGPHLAKVGILVYATDARHGPFGPWAPWAPWAFWAPWPLWALGWGTPILGYPGLG